MTAVSAPRCSGDGWVGSTAPVRPRRTRRGSPETKHIRAVRLRTRRTYTMLPAPALPRTTENDATSAEPRHGAAAVCATAALAAAESASAATATGAATPLMGVSLP